MKTRINVVVGKTVESLCVLQNGDYKIVPRSNEVEEIIKYYQVTYRSESAELLVVRIGNTFACIPRERITKFKNTNKDHGLKNPRFDNKATLKPVVSHTVNSRHQIDLVDFRSMPVLKNNEVYSWVFSLMDVFSRYLWLRPMMYKEPAEVLMHLKKIYR